jgi:hypothetical protein
MGTGTSSKTTEEDVRNRLNSGDFQKISPPSSPSIDAKKDEYEMSYSGILVEKPGSETPVAPSDSTSAATSASFAADLSTPPISNKSKSRTNAKAAAAASKEHPRRIVKATPPPSSKVAADADDSRNEKDKDNDAESPAVHHPPSLASPIGANAATEMLEESIEKNDSKNKRMERVTNKQKSDRERLLQEKRRRQQPGSDDKHQVQANPFSRFLSAFSVDTNPTHKRKESNDAGDPNKRLKFGFPDSAAKADESIASGEQNPSTAGSSSEDGGEDALPFFRSPWFAAVSVATVAVLVLAIVRGSKNK